MRKLKLPGREGDQPRLTEQDVELIAEAGIDQIKEQARNIVEKKLREQPDNDGNQTPKAGNPVYKAMHACRASSRKELSQGHKIPAGKELTDNQIDSIVNMLMRWIVREHNFYIEERREKQKNLSYF